MNGLCDICGEPKVSLNNCWLCGSMICEECFEPELRLCHSCAHEKASPRRF